MTYPIKTQTLVGLALSLLLLAACSPAAAPTSAPTPDENPLRTQVAATVFAQVTRDLASTPSVTPQPSPTQALPPTNTPVVAASATLAASATAAGATQDNTTTSNGQASATPNVAANNHAQFVSQTVADNTLYAPGATFTMVWRLKNTGVDTWSAAYLLRYYSGETFGAPKEIAIGKEVKPGEEVDISLQMKAPAVVGTYTSTWVMSTASRVNFKDPVFLTIKVALPPTATATAKP